MYIRDISQADIDRARELRAKKVRWHEIGKQIGCATETIRRRVEPEFDEACRKRYAERARNRSLAGAAAPPDSRAAIPKEAQELPEPRHTAQRRVDLVFQNRMHRAIAIGTERASVGVDKRPSSPDGRYIPVTRAYISPGSSPGAQCAELGEGK
jgi:hypothetical protein